MSSGCSWGGMGGGPEKRRCITHATTENGCDDIGCPCFRSPKPLGVMAGMIIYSMSPIKAMAGGNGSAGGGGSMNTERPKILAHLTHHANTPGIPLAADMSCCVDVAIGATRKYHMIQLRKRFEAIASLPRYAIYHDESCNKRTKDIPDEWDCDCFLQELSDDIFGKEQDDGE